MYSEEGYHALRHHAGVVKRDDRGVLVLTGSERLTWLQGLVTNDVAALRPETAIYAAYLTPQGRMITDLRAIGAPDRTVLDVPGLLARTIRTKFDSLIFAEDVSVVDASEAMAILEVHGPDAPQIIETLAASAAKYTAARDDVYGVPGYVLVVTIEMRDQIVATCVAAGAREVSLETVDVVRIEAGSPAFLVDMDEHTIPLEAGLERRAISFTKGCYVGQEIIVRVTHRGQGRVARKLVGLRFDKGAVSKSGDRILHDDREVGRVTSATWSPTIERTIALGYVHRDHAEHSTVLSVHSDGGGTVKATVTALPFVEPFLQQPGHGNS
jgi:folate-binding protein YgfZ